MTGWPEETILHMPLAKVTQYQHCVMRHNGIRTRWGSTVTDSIETLSEQMQRMRRQWEQGSVDVKEES